MVMCILFTAAALNEDFCIVNRGGVVPLARISNLEEFPIYRNLSVVQFDIVNPNNSTYPVSVATINIIIIISGNECFGESGK